ncbi:MAG: class I SAM-dependent methyltransferase [Fimbriimonadales bacterium]
MNTRSRRRLQGTCEIVKYNSHQYLAVVGFVAVAIGLLLFLDLPPILSLTLVVAVCVVGYWSIASLIASFIVYDASKIYDPGWMGTLIDDTPSTWANIHAGVDDFSRPLSGPYGPARYNWDIFDEKTMTEPSILRARSTRNVGETVDFRELPCKTDELEAVFAFFVLHEIRDASLRHNCFDEIARCLAPSGKLVIVEHLRDLPNFVAFGPGSFHFWPRSEWLRSAALSGFKLLKETNMTAFVRVMVFTKP